MGSTRIAYLTSEYPAPSHTFIRREVEALRARGIDVCTFSVRRPKNGTRLSEPDEREKAATVYLLPISAVTLVLTHLAALLRRPGAYFSTLLLSLKHRVPGIRALIWSAFYFAEAIVLASQLSKHQISHLHNHFANSGANVGLLASQFLGIPWSVTLHGTADWDYPAGPLLSQKIEMAEFVACVSQFGRAQAMAICRPAVWPKVFVSRCGVDLSRFPVRRRERQAPSRIQILAVGRLSPEKGHAGLLTAFAQIIEQGIDAEMRIIGEGPLRSEIAQRVKELNLQNRCTLLGQKTEEEVFDEMSRSDLFVQSSFMEGLPVVLMEALALRLPVIAPCIAGIPELVRSGETGLLFNVGDWSQLGAQLKRAAVDSTLRNQLAERGHQLVAEMFDIHKAVEPIAKRFEELQRRSSLLRDKCDFDRHGAS